MTLAAAPFVWMEGGAPGGMSNAVRSPRGLAPKPLLFDEQSFDISLNAVLDELDESSKVAAAKATDGGGGGGIGGGVGGSSVRRRHEVPRRPSQQTLGKSTSSVSRVRRAKTSVAQGEVFVPSARGVSIPALPPPVALATAAGVGGEAQPSSSAPPITSSHTLPKVRRNDQRRISETLRSTQSLDLDLEQHLSSAYTAKKTPSSHKKPSKSSSGALPSLVSVYQTGGPHPPVGYNPATSSLVSSSSAAAASPANSLSALTSILGRLGASGATLRAIINPWAAAKENSAAAAASASSTAASSRTATGGSTSPSATSSSSYNVFQRGPNGAAGGTVLLASVAPLPPGPVPLRRGPPHATTSIGGGSRRLDDATTNLSLPMLWNSQSFSRDSGGTLSPLADCLSPYKEDSFAERYGGGGGDDGGDGGGGGGRAAPNLNAVWSTLRHSSAPIDPSKSPMLDEVLRLQMPLSSAVSAPADAASQRRPGGDSPLRAAAVAAAPLAPQPPRGGGGGGRAQGEFQRRPFDRASLLAARGGAAPPADLPVAVQPPVEVERSRTESPSGRHGLRTRERAQVNVDDVWGAELSGPLDMLVLPKPEPLFDEASYVERPQREDGSPQKIEPHVGVTMEWLLLYAQHIATLTGGGSGPDKLPAWEVKTSDIMRRFVMPQTASRRCKLSDLVPKRHILKPALFISHSHVGSFTGMLNTMLRFCALNDLPHATTSVFLDVVCLNPHAQGLLPECMIVHWQLVQRCKHLLWVIDHKGSSLSRLWCCYEVWIAALADRASILTASLIGVTKARHDKLQIMFDHADLEALVEVFSTLELSRLQVRDAADRTAIEDHTTSQALGVDLDGLDVMLPTVHTVMQQVARNAYDGMGGSRSAFPLRYLEASLTYTNTLVLVGSNWEAERLLRQDQSWLIQRRIASDGTRLVSHNISVLAKLSGDMAAAETMSLELLGRTVDPETRVPPAAPHEQLMERMVLIHLEDMYFRADDWARSEKLCRMMTGYDEGLRPGVSVLQPVRHLAHMLMQENKQLLNVKHLLHNASELAMEEFGHLSLEAAAFQFLLTAFYQRVHDNKEAATMIERCIYTRQLICGETHPLTLEATVAQFGVQIDMLQFDAVEGRLEEVYKQVQFKLGAKHAVTLQTKGHIVTLRDALVSSAHKAMTQKCDAEAEALLHRALKVHKLVREEAFERQLLLDLQKALTKQGKVDELRFLNRRLIETHPATYV